MFAGHDRWRILILVLCCILATGCDSEVKNAVRQTLIDPDSAQFRNIESCEHDPSVVRGEVNSRNRLGGYVGFQSFYYVEGRVEFVGVDATSVDLMERCFGLRSSPELRQSNDALAVPETTGLRDAERTRQNDYPMDDDDAELISLCYGHYCPCEPHPDNGTPEAGICRRLENGVHVSNSEFETAATLRDARQGIREFERSEERRLPPREITDEPEHPVPEKRNVAGGTTMPEPRLNGTSTNVGDLASSVASGNAGSQEPGEGD